MAHKFNHWVDAGDLGEIDIEVHYEYHRPCYDMGAQMEILKVIWQGIDIADFLTDDARENLRIECFEWNADEASCAAESYGDEMREHRYFGEAA